MNTRTIMLTQANEEGFDPEKFHFDIKNMSNVQVYRVIRVTELIKQDNLHYVKLEFNEGDVSDPDADPIIIGTISRFVEDRLDHQWRAMWDDKLWRILSDDTVSILECFQGISKERIEAFAGKLSKGWIADNLAKGWLKTT